MKVKIIFELTDKPRGGGNQFLKALKNCLSEMNVYTANHQDADVFLFNSYQYLPEVIRLKIKYPDKLFIHRIDGPIRLYHKMSDKRDSLINLSNRLIADATVFQSHWSKAENQRLGLKVNNFETIITNAPDGRIFNTTDKSIFDRSRTIKLIATSWSNFHKKGFSTYRWLDENLDFKRYEMTFCGNSPIKFKNIRHIKPLSSNELATELKQSDIFITASEQDPCSNSLIEALHCGLPAIALNDGGHPEIVKSGGLLYKVKEEIPLLLDYVSGNYAKIQSQINLPAIKTLAENYLEFIQNILNAQIEKKYQAKKISKRKKMFMFLKIISYKLNAEFQNLNKTKIDNLF